MQIEMDHVIIAHTVLPGDLVQVFDQCFVGARAQDLNLDAQVGLAQGLHQGTRDGAITDVAHAIGSRGNNKQVNRCCWLYARLQRSRLHVATHHRGLQSQRLSEARIFEGLPMQRMKPWRACNLDLHPLQTRLDSSPVGEDDIRIILENLFEEPLAISDDTGGSLFSTHLLGERELQMLLKVPLKLTLLLFLKRVTHGNLILRPVIKANHSLHISVLFSLLLANLFLLLDTDDGCTLHARILLTPTLTLLLVDIGYKALRAIGLFHAFDMCMDAATATFLQHFHDHLRTNIAGRPRGNANENGGDQRQIVFCAFSGDHASLTNRVGFGELVPGGHKISRLIPRSGERISSYSRCAIRPPSTCHRFRHMVSYIALQASMMR